MKLLNLIMLLPYFTKHLVEAGCDEAGRGCLAGPVYAAAVILPKGFNHPLLMDSKKLSADQRKELAKIIRNKAISYAVQKMSPAEIDRFNILNASIRAMHKAIRRLAISPQLILVDGNRFHQYQNIPFECVIKGDDKYTSIAAASILAKVARDQYMVRAASQYPHYGWETNKGYPTLLHRDSIKKYGISPLHRHSFKLFPHNTQMDMFE